MRREPDPTAIEPMKSTGPWGRLVHWVAICAAVLTLPLLYVGGSVTTYRVGLAVPDWPTTFDENMFLYNFWDAPFGVRIEHLHRLYGAAVGVATIVLTGCLLAFDRRRWMKGLGILALAAVVLQGVLGGLRVTERSTLLAAVHGATGQAFFGLMVAMAVLTGRDWNGDAGRAADPTHLRRRSSVLLVLLYVQILLGSWVRHYGTAGAIWSHALFAVAVWAHVAGFAYRLERSRPRIGPLIVPNRALILTVTVQIVLGLAALVYVLPIGGSPRAVTLYQGAVRTAHQTNAAVLFAAAIVLALRTYRHLAGASSVVAAQPGDQPADRPIATAPDWEAVT